MNSHVARNPVVYAISMLLTVGGLAVLLLGEYTGATTTLVPAGGAVVLAGVALLTVLVAMLSGGEHATH